MLLPLVVFLMMFIVAGTADVAREHNSRHHYPYSNDFTNNHHRRLSKVSNYRQATEELDALLNDFAGNNNNDDNDAFNNFAKNKRESFPSDVYPGIMTDPGTATTTKKPEQLSKIGGELNYNSLLNQLHQLQTSGQLAALTNANSRDDVAAPVGNATTTTMMTDNEQQQKANKVAFKPTDGIKETADASGGSGNSSDTSCNSYIDPTNATAVLERVLQELELIKSAKLGNMTPEGAPCPITNVWNSEIIGLRFNISSNDNSGTLNVALMEHKPPRENAQMDTNWTCSGYALHTNGGPFYLTAIKKHKEMMATFAGICKTCGGMDTIFGVWNFVHSPKDCRDLQMFVETKRDIFRKDTLIRAKQKAKITTTTTEKPSAEKAKLNKETKDLLDELASYLM